jgi:SUN family beta-glucosidase
MTLPIDSQPGTDIELAVIDQNEYFRWQGKPTSAQYYINPAGVPVQEACIWGNGAKRVGNWAPLNMGGSWVGNEGFWSLFTNNPTQIDGYLDYDIKVSGDVSFECAYGNGQICANGVCHATVGQISAQGCTVSVRPGGSIFYTLMDKE